MKICSTCKGRGQTKACATEFHFEPREVGGKQYVTDKLGSGCMKCLGRGIIEVTDSK